ncbi:LysR family transcriptional regulator [Oscillochloris sp. ZM17-4]|uniref:LysR family transcriptional regulator n=1 Tax=Oscillochloris sp. ZM17-4 TaxID=2866714 RepID=UPI001C72FB57|nr:LysR family transcriptional regulator [Oscillochloris sp. ZM17-4]MBX0329615.1 LysR family transcriptional regulator [Oscillochloris sp. ZM17-4]
MELRHLIYFATVARHEHVSRAAIELAVAQPAITKQLKDLERELGGGPLFERVGRRLRLTETGKVLLDHTRTILADVEAAKAELRERGGTYGGRVGIGAPPSIGERLLPDVLRHFHQDYPNVELHIAEGDSQALLQRLNDGQIDLAVVTLPVVQRGLSITELFSEDLVLVLATEHRLAGAQVLSIAELGEERFLLYSPAGYVRQALSQACRQAGFTPQVVLDSGSMELLLRLVEANLGVAVIPRMALGGDERLAVVPLHTPTISRTMALVSREGRTLAPAAARMRDYLIERLRR